MIRASHGRPGGLAILPRSVPGAGGDFAAPGALFLAALELGAIVAAASDEETSGRLLHLLASPTRPAHEPADGVIEPPRLGEQPFVFLKTLRQMGQKHGGEQGVINSLKYASYHPIYSGVFISYIGGELVAGSYLFIFFTFLILYICIKQGKLEEQLLLNHEKV